MQKEQNSTLFRTFSHLLWQACTLWLQVSTTITSSSSYNTNTNNGKRNCIACK